jgi:periplasmic protein TonB
VAKRLAFEAGAGAKKRVEPLTEALHLRYVGSLLFAIGIHASILFWWPKDLLFQPAEYGVVSGESAMEVALVAVLPSLQDEPHDSQEPVEPQKNTEPHEPVDAQYLAMEGPLTPLPLPASAAVEERTEAEQMPSAKPRPTRTAVASATPSSQRKPVRVRSTGSSSGRNSAMSGNTSSTASQTSGSLTAKAAYLFNPHPPYPEASRRAHHIGLVMLRVSVNEHGRVSAVKVVKSSGYSLLDGSARATLQRWVFKPARQAGRPVATQIDVPIRFSLNR